MDKNYRSIKYKWKYDKVDGDILARVASENNIPVPVAELMIKKGLETKEDIDLFFNGSLKSLRNPFDILDMEKAAERIV